MTEYTNILITNRLATGTTFAVVQNNHSEQVFVPARSVADLHVQAGDVVKAVLVPNARDPERTKWLAVKVCVDTKTKLDLLVDDIVSELRDDGSATLEELAYTLQVSTEEVEAALTKAIATGRVIREVVYCSVV